MNAPTRETGFFTEALQNSDPEIAKAITQELGRQRDEIEPVSYTHLTLPTTPYV